jgi:hypothetical protein
VSAATPAGARRSPFAARTQDSALARPAIGELSPGAVALLNAIASAAPASTDPWAPLPPVLGIDHVAAVLSMTPGSARRGNIPMSKRLGRYLVDQTVFGR